VYPEVPYQSALMLGQVHGFDQRERKRRTREVDKAPCTAPGPAIVVKPRNPARWLETETRKLDDHQMHHIYTDEEMLRRLKRRAGIASLGALRHFEKLVARRRRELILEARREGWGWYELSVMLHVSPQAVHQRWKRYMTEERHEDEDDLDE
jgi:hypothetical protein